MNLREYLRSEWSIYIRNSIIKDRCEICGGNLDLHLHHIEKFDSLLIETLNELKLKELDTEQYEDYELNLISNVMLGKQVKCKYQTLCKECHIEKHKHECEERKSKKELERQKYINEILIPYLNSIVGKRLFKDEKKELIEMINLRVDGKQKRSYSKLNDFFKEINLECIITPKRSGSVRYWILKQNKQ